MSIDPNTLPDGTVMEMDNGRLRFNPFSWGGRIIVRTYTPDPTPDQEVPRDEWANIAVGSRVRIVEVNGDEHTVTLDYVTADPWLYSKDHGYDGAKIARAYLLDAPTPPDPDAELVEKMARANFELAWPGCDWATWADHTKDRYRTRASAVLAVVREHEAKS